MDLKSVALIANERGVLIETYRHVENAHMKIWYVAMTFAFFKKNIEIGQ
jgi:hypothetical protein